jgi:hypothetical protein
MAFGLHGDCDGQVWNVTARRLYCLGALVLYPVTDQVGLEQGWPKSAAELLDLDGSCVLWFMTSYSLVKFIRRC